MWDSPHAKKATKENGDVGIPPMIVMIVRMVYENDWVNPTENFDKLIGSLREKKSKHYPLVN